MACTLHLYSQLIFVGYIPHPLSMIQTKVLINNGIYIQTGANTSVYWIPQLYLCYSLVTNYKSG